MGRDQIATMRALGHESFAVAGHDRGARVAYRIALDHPERVTRLAVLDIVPTVEMWDAANAEAAMGNFHWYLLAQPEPLPETLIASDPEFWLRHLLARWAGDGFEFDAESVADYVACFRDPASIHATCEDYRAGRGADQEDDERDRGRRRIEAPLLALWGAGYSVAKAKPLETWQRWATDVQGHSVPGGHFVPEESPEETATALLEFFGG
jgi:haloacetate dehalogenase